MIFFQMEHRSAHVPKPIDIGRAADSKEPKHDSFVMFCQS